LGDGSQTDFAGRPGTGYARILREDWTNIAPSVSYWNPTRVISDTRLAAGTYDSNTVVFEAPSSTRQQFDVLVRLMYRRTFAQIADWKDWQLNDIVLAEESVQVGGTDLETGSN
jgi:hypothetical protein